MSKTLRALVVAATLLTSLFGATTAAFAATTPTTASQASHAASGILAPQAKYNCATTFTPPYTVFTYSCVITAGFVQYIATCDDDVTRMTTGWLPVGIWRGNLTCKNGILYVSKFTQG